MQPLHQLIRSVTTQLYTNSVLKSLLIGVSVALPVSLFSVGIGLVLGTLVLASVGAAWWLGAFEPKREAAIGHLHKTLGQTEYSLPLLTKEHPNLAEQLQLERLAEQAAQTPRPLVAFQNLRPYLLLLLASGAVFAAFRFWPTAAGKRANEATRLADRQMAEKAIPILPPTFRSAQLTVQPPAYTDLPTRTGADLNVTAYVGSTLTWQVTLSEMNRTAVKLVNSRGEEIPFARQQAGFQYQDRLLNSGLYALRAYWKTPANRDSLIYQSDFYRLDARPDVPPVIKPAAKELYRFHRMGESMQVRVTAQISDDFRVQQAFIVATLARGSGENVKFRETRFPVSSGPFRTAQAGHTLDLAKLGFAPGDELYYYWAAIDNRQPEPQLTKSDTYFVVFKDTARNEEAELATMAVNIMPEYFRSQRQIIIDTDKLIAKRKKMAAKAFNTESNEIGFDQKVLRLRYGQYMGEEFENQIGGHTPLADNDADLLEGYVHKHDTQEDPNGGPAETHEKGGEHHGHDDHDHDHGGKPGEEKDPLAAMMEQYVHNHDNGEVNTFYEQSTRSLLKMALEQMWQSELQLRLYEPEKARPYEVKALEYLKIAQQKARAYAKKSGYDPPPLKEKETRLTGELGDVPNKHLLTRNYADMPVSMLVAQVLGLVDLPTLTPVQRQQVSQLSTALSGPLMRSGMPNWSVLADLQRLASGQRLSALAVAQLQTKLAQFAPASADGGRSAPVADKRLEDAFWRGMK
ncbi:hypothetical protein [Fibrella forsythiae]|uniref:DUF4175 domain-containing protein n=1 Tax=Fibrella forsythiae TaxID=2817061 RepID=A0ABS3JNY6_9BACT|nr:hypothetical protein [Fibrella forsythiae]MBO0951712.1 hypothetical protein [Fibrella forsythiae]